MRRDQRLHGRVFIEAIVCGQDLQRVVFHLEGERLKNPIDFTDATAPYIFSDPQRGDDGGWNTSSYPDGAYTLTATVFDAQGRRDLRYVRFRLDNHQHDDD